MLGNKCVFKMIPSLVLEGIEICMEFVGWGGRNEYNILFSI